MIGEGRAPVREGAKLFDADDNEIGEVCSGGFGPAAEKPVAIAYVSPEFAKIDTGVFAEVRNKKLPMTVSKTPFVPNGYFRG